MSATTTQLLSSGEFCKLRYDTMPVKSASANVLFSIPISQKCQILSCDTLVANERYGGVAVKLRSFLTSAIGGGEWSASRFSRLTTMSVAISSTLRCHIGSMNLY
jgi:hypothetical protein